MSSLTLASGREFGELRRKIALQRQYINRLRLRVEQVTRELRAAGWEPPVEDPLVEDVVGGSAGTPARGSTALSPKLLEEELLLYADELHQLVVRSDRLRQRSNQMATEAVRVVLTLQHVAAPEVFAHAARVARFSEAIARSLGWEEDHRVTLRLVALCHDVGKVFPAGATAGGVDRHPALGAQLLSKAASLRTVAGMVKAHHERPDGAGYPDGLRGDDIPAESLVVAVANAVDHAAGPDGVEGLPVEDLVTPLVEQPGAFSPEVVRVLPAALQSLRQPNPAGDRRRPG